MQILDLKQAAALLKIAPEILRRKARLGIIPAAKPAKRWIFLKEDLVEYLRSIYPNQAKASWSAPQKRRNKKWHSINEKISTGSVLTTT